MKYLMKSGTLYDETGACPLARIRNGLVGPARRVLLPDDTVVVHTDVRAIDAAPEHRGDARCSEYVLLDRQDRIIASARPNYAEGENPDTAGWPIHRLPRVDHALVSLGDADFLLMMHNSQYYALRDGGGQELLRILHRGVCGGWTLEDEHGFTLEMLCGLYVFCRYIEQENEFLIV